MRRLLTATAALAIISGGSAFAQTAATHSTSHSTHATSSMTAGAKPMANPNAPGNAAVKTPDAMGTASAGANSFTEGQARTRITKAGYSNVSALSKDADGLWHGKAKKGRKSMNVSLDFKGNVNAK